MTDTKIKLALVNMLPEKIGVEHHKYGEPEFYWKQATLQNEVINSEWIHVCWLVEETITDKEQQESYTHTLLGLIIDTVEVEYGPLNLTQADILWMLTHSTWQQRAQALIKVKGTP